jgi:hypothetical protein
MVFEQYSFLAVVILGVASAFVLLSPNWRWRVGGLAVQYLGVFWLVAISWSSGLAAVKLVTGWMAGAILGVSRIGQLAEDRRRWPTEWLFFGLVVVLVLVTVSAVAPTVSTWLPDVHPDQVLGAIMLVGMGMIHLGMASRGIRVILSLLTLLSGFEILYAGIETSTLVAGLLAVINLGVALVGAYLLSDDEEVEVV